MSPSFRERQGLKKPRVDLQIGSIDDALRAALWNVLDHIYWSRDGFLFAPSGGYGGNTGRIGEFSRRLWAGLFDQPVDDRPSYPDKILAKIREFYFGASWDWVYEFVEFVIGIAQQERAGLIVHLNRELERHSAGYRVINEIVTPLTNEAEIEAVQQVLDDDQFAGAQKHIEAALALFSNRRAPDYRNSIKESISAVESVAKIVAQNPRASLGDALAQMEKMGRLHRALKSGFSNLYGYTSDADGIRHAMIDAKEELTAADARYFLVSCSAFVNYLKAQI